MMNLIRSDFYKLRKAKYFLTCLIITVGLACAYVFILDFVFQAADGQIGAQMKQQQDTLNESGVSITAPGIPTSRDELKASTQMISFLSEATVTLILAVLVSLFVGSEFNNGTIKNIASRNYSRKEIYLSKLAVSVITGISFMLVYTLASTITASVLWGFGTVSSGFWLTFLKAAGIELLLGSAYISIFVMFSILIRQNGGSLAANICFLEFVSLFAMIGELILKKITGNDYTLSNYLPDINMQNVAADFNRTTAIRGICVAVVFFLASALIGMASFQRRDIK